MEKIVICDICNTLYKVNTFNKFLEYLYLEKKIIFYIKKSFIYKVICFCLSKIKIDLNKKILVRLLKGYSKKELDYQAEIFVKEVLKDYENLIVFDYLKNYKKNKYKIILVSGTLDSIAKAICKTKNFENYIAVTLEEKNGMLTGRIKEEILYTKHEKVQEKLCSGEKELVVITDNETDLELLKMANAKIVVTSQKKLKFWEKNLSEYNYEVILLDD